MGAGARRPGVIELDPIGWVRSSRTDVLDDDWDSVRSVVELDAGRFRPESLQGLAEFSHVEVVYVFDRVEPGHVHTGARHPRNNPDWPAVGIFAQRARNRPNRLGITTCRLTALAGLTLTVEGLDAVDGSPVVDIKPYMTEFGPRGVVRQPAWSSELMRGYWGSGTGDSS
jgi:tRNA-Thr(GGU) m(6)t(6)A37 methyltransferase TsaA